MGAGMKLTPFLRRALPVLTLFVGFAAPLAAQNTVFADLDGKYLAVRKVYRNTPVVEVDGKMVFADGGRFTMRKVEEYLPVFVDVQNVEVKTRHLNTTKGDTLNREFIFRATLDTPYDLDDVYLVLELNSGGEGKMLFLQEVGKLEPRRFKTVSAVVNLAFDMGRGKYVLHLFAGGREVLQSKIPPLQRDAALDRMTARRIAGVQDASPSVLTGPAPEYPPELLKAKTKGQAVISIRIGANGQVYDPTEKSATDPAFGKSALEAVRLWRFLPRVVGGRPVETRLDVPFNFAPPEKNT